MLPYKTRNIWYSEISVVVSLGANQQQTVRVTCTIRVLGSTPRSHKLKLDHYPNIAAAVLKFNNLLLKLKIFKSYRSSSSFSTTICLNTQDCSARKFCYWSLLVATISHNLCLWYYVLDLHKIVVVFGQNFSTMLQTCSQIFKLCGLNTAFKGKLRYPILDHSPFRNCCCVSK